MSFLRDSGITGYALLIKSMRAEQPSIDGSRLPESANFRCRPLVGGRMRPLSGNSAAIAVNKESVSRSHCASLGKKFR